MRKHACWCRSFLAPLLLCALLASCAGPGALQGRADDLTGRQGVRGMLTYQGKPLGDAYVYAYRSSSQNLLGPADFASDPSTADGSYTVELVKGTYYLVARKRARGENTGPLTIGDYYSIYSANPVTVADGRYTAVDLDLARLDNPMFFQRFTREESDTGIRGTIVDEAGKPVPWVFAMAYRDNRMKRIPDFTSTATTRDGTFVIYLPHGGRYWVAARKNLKDRPVAGEPYGLYQGSPDHSIEVPGGSFVVGVKITLERYHKGIQD